MASKKAVLKIALATASVILAATPAFAKGINLKDAGISLWIFLIIGAMIVLLQLIPAAILFFSFIGTTSAMVFKGKRIAGKEGAAEQQKQELTGQEAVVHQK